MPLLQPPPQSDDQPLDQPLFQPEFQPPHGSQQLFQPPPPRRWNRPPRRPKAEAVSATTRVTTNATAIRIPHRFIATSSCCGRTRYRPEDRRPATLPGIPIAFCVSQANTLMLENASSFLVTLLPKM
jgi:hypothetical protein